MKVIPAATSMNISVKGEYALQAIFDLATQRPGEPVRIARHRPPPGDPAEVSGADPRRPQAGRLRGVAARRGRRLSAGARGRIITVGEVLRFVEGPQQGKARPRRKGDTPFTDMWQQVDQAVSDIVDKTTFADLLHGWTEKQNRYVLNWEI